jgi:hypothetical protein
MAKILMVVMNSFGILMVSECMYNVMDVEVILEFSNEFIDTSKGSSS